MNQKEKEYQQKENLAKQEDTIDIIALLKECWNARKLILRFIAVFGFLGLFVAIFTPNKYTATSTFVPLVQSDGGVGKLGGLASLAGISLGGGVSNSEISPELYPQIFNSVPFQLELLDTPLTIAGQEKAVTYRDYYTTFYSPGLLANIKKYTIGLPSLFLGLFKSDEIPNNQLVGSSSQNILNISKVDSELIKVLEEQLSLAVNAKEGFISLEASMPEAKPSAQLTKKAQELLQKYVLRFKTQKSQEQLAYIKARNQEKEKEFQQAKYALAKFQDQNKGINTAMGRSRLLQLQADYDLVFSVYNELAKQQETQELQVKKDTPLFTVLKPVTVPKEKSAPKRALILVVYLFLGGVIGLGVVFGNKYWKELKREWALK